MAQGTKLYRLCTDLEIFVSKVVIIILKPDTSPSPIFSLQIFVLLEMPCAISQNHSSCCFN